VRNNRSVVARQPDVVTGLFVAGVGVYISRVEEGSVAERAGLRPGDTILEVNGTPFSTISHEEALKVSSHVLISCRCFC
jgi:S1-C subfamily serine protease